MMEKVKILFFGATAEIVRSREIALEIHGQTTSQAIFEQLLEKYPELFGRRLHFSVNQQYATGREIVRDSDEIAVFTAVSGG